MQIPESRHQTSTTCFRDFLMCYANSLLDYYETQYRDKENIEICHRDLLSPRENKTTWIAQNRYLDDSQEQYTPSVPKYKYFRLWYGLRDAILTNDIVIVCLMINLVTLILHDWSYFFLLLIVKITNIWFGTILKMLIFYDRVENLRLYCDLLERGERERYKLYWNS